VCSAGISTKKSDSSDCTRDKGIDGAPANNIETKAYELKRVEEGENGTEGKNTTNKHEEQTLQFKRKSIIVNKKEITTKGLFVECEQLTNDNCFGHRRPKNKIK
jgi:hypothetical protein